MTVVVRAWRLVAFVVFYLWELVAANALIAFEVVTPRRHLRPGLIAVPVRVESALHVTLLANLISLTPGTLTIDVSPDARVLYVHGMHVKSPEHLRTQIRKLEDRLLGVVT